MVIHRFCVIIYRLCVIIRSLCMIIHRLCVTVSRFSKNKNLSLSNIFRNRKSNAVISNEKLESGLGTLCLDIDDTADSVASKISVWKKLQIQRQC